MRAKRGNRGRHARASRSVFVPGKTYVRYFDYTGRSANSVPISNIFYTRFRRQELILLQKLSGRYVMTSEFVIGGVGKSRTRNESINGVKKNFRPITHRRHSNDNTDMEFITSAVFPFENLIDQSRRSLFHSTRNPYVYTIKYSSILSVTYGFPTFPRPRNT